MIGVEMKERVIIAMSGGVDSSVAAALLKDEGYEVIGITMCFSAAERGGFANFCGKNLPDLTAKRPTCCGIRGIEDAQRVAHKLGIRHYVVNMQKELEKYVIKDFCQEYFRGRTPNPCVRCNQYIKFGALLKKALALGAKFLATGHYARIERSPGYQVIRSSVYLLKKGKDRLKDQSYFLYRLGQKQLKHILFPLGNYTKGEVRKLARKLYLPVADKLASQEICFLSDTDYRGFLKHRLHRFPPKRLADSPMHCGEKDTDYTDLRPGLVIDKQGNLLGKHKGIAFYTIGQREGLGIACGYPIYITKIDSKNNRIVVGKKEDVYAQDFLVKDIHFICRPLKKKIVAKVRIRYNHQEAPAEIMPFRNQIKVHFGKPQFAITPGQSAVFYDKDKVLGGGIIHRLLD